MITDTESRLRSVARVDPYEEAPLLSAIVTTALQSLVLLEPDKAEESVRLAIRRARLNAALENVEFVSDIEDAIEAYCREHKIARDDLLAKRRADGVWGLRLGLYRRLDDARTTDGRRRWTREEIGRAVGRDHSTITQTLNARRRA